jgi:hypothetical protein
MNNSNTDDNRELDSALLPLGEQTWTGGPAGHARVERRLLEAHTRSANAMPNRIIAYVFRHRLAVAMLGIALLAGGAIAGSYYFNRLYRITVSDDQGNVITAPRILVAPGQSASITIGDADDPDNVLSVSIDENGNVTSNRDGVNVDVDVQDVDGNEVPVTKPDGG